MSQRPLSYNDVKHSYDTITPKTVSTGAEDAGKIFVLGADGKWDDS